VALLLALASAAVYGAGDFLGGLASRRAAALLVVGVSQFVGLAVAVVLALLLGGELTGADAAWAAVGGLTGAAGLGIFYRALADGSMSVVAPVTAVCAAGVPVLAGLVGGDVISTAAFVGLVLALPAVGLVAREPGAGARVDVRTVAVALAAGTLFGTFFVLLDRTSDGSGLWPIVVARLASSLAVAVLVVGVFVALRGRPGRAAPRLPRSALPLVVAAGVADMSANVLFLLAVRQGQLSVVGLLSSLYPVSTVLLATLLLRERLSRLQLAGVGGCTLAVVLIASS
jgi:drug/metabolite transporter (DMT)-like permease